MAPQASKKCGLLPPDHPRIGSYKSNGIDSEQVLGTFSILTSSSLTSQASAQRETWFLRHFHVQKIIEGSPRLEQQFLSNQEGTDETR